LNGHRYFHFLGMNGTRRRTLSRSAQCGSLYLSSSLSRITNPR
jgi:hypothetical protein